MEETTLIFSVSGMECKPCAVVIEKELSDLSYVTEVIIEFESKRLKISGDFKGIPEQALAEDFTNLLCEYGYRFAPLPANDPENQ